MFSQHPRVGFACKIQKVHGTADPKMNTKATTIAWLQWANNWAQEFLEYADIMLESKEKNLAADQFCSGIKF